MSPREGGNMDKRHALGKGLSALIPDVPEPQAVTTEVDVDRLVSNDYQPRAQFDEEGLEGLTESIRSAGVIQPIVVRQVGDRYQIIAGERRWRAAKRAGLSRVPIVIRDLPPGNERLSLELALVENIQREDLNPIEEALAYRRLADEFLLKQEEIAAAVGKDRASVANHLRLLKLPDEVRARVGSRALSMGHARALLSLPSEAEQCRVAGEIIDRGLSVRDTELLVKSLTSPVPETTSARTPKPADVHTRTAEERLRLALGTRVHIVRKGKRGRIVIDFVSEDELIRLYDQLTEGRN
jgi:ParB family transcriptional regulator, chromosome partitioning protein